MSSSCWYCCDVSGSILALAVLSLSVVLCAICLGLLFAAVTTSEKQLGGIGSVVLLVMGLLGGLWRFQFER